MVDDDRDFRRVSEIVISIFMYNLIVQGDAGIFLQGLAHLGSVDMILTHIIVVARAHFCSA